MTEWSQKQTSLTMRVAELQRENEKLHEALRIECELNATPVGIIKDRARMEERAAIVAWLRDDADQVVNADSPVYGADIIAEAIVECAVAIEAGEHLK